MDSTDGFEVPGDSVVPMSFPGRYHCNSDCLLLSDCGTQKRSTCGGSLYLRNLDMRLGSRLATEILDPAKCHKGCWALTVKGFKSSGGFRG